MQIVKQFIGIRKQEKEFIEIETDQALFRFYFLNENILRINCSFEKEFQDNSYILCLTGWEDQMDEVMKQYRKRVTCQQYEIQQDEKKLVMKNAFHRIEVQKSPFQLQIFDKEGQVIYSDYKEMGFIRTGKGEIQNNFIYDKEKENFYGLGESTGKLNKKGQRIYQNPRDSIAYDPKGNQPLYKHIPFLIRLLNNKSSGIFYHNTYQSFFDLGNQISGYRLNRAYFEAKGGNLDLFIIQGPSIKNVVRNFTDLVGKPCFLPIKAYGYLASSMYYAELKKDCDKKIIGFIEECDENQKVAVDNFHLSSGYCVDKSGFRQFFIWNKEKFSDLNKFTQQLQNLKISLTVNIKPGILISHPMYEELNKNNFFIQKNNKTHQDLWWGGQGSFVDFTNPETRARWKILLKDYYLKQGVNSIWNDNNEYDSILEQDSVSTSLEGIQTKLEQTKVVMSLLMNHTAKEALQEQFPTKRTYIVTRSGCSGLQRYAQTWGGDNFTSWKSLKYNIPMILNASLSGLSNYGCDIGGFAGPAPEQELFLRWVQNGIFQPRFSIHSCNNDNTVSEPWMYQQIAGKIRSLINLRYRLLPTLYSLGYKSSLTGDPIISPLVYEFQEDENSYEENFNFLMGRDLLISSVIEKGQQENTIYLPKNAKWVNFWDGRQIFEGGQKIKQKCGVEEQLNLFVRDGAILVLSNKQEFQRAEEILDPQNEIQVYMVLPHYLPFEKKTFQYFQDDGETNSDQFNLIEFSIVQILNESEKYEKPPIYQINIERKINKQIDKLQQISFIIAGLTKAPLNIRNSSQDFEVPQFLIEKEFNSTKEGWRYDHQKNLVYLKVAKQQLISSNVSFFIDFNKFDLIKISGNQSE